MKKIIRILGIFFVTLVILFNANTTNGLTRGFELASITSMNTANAECNSSITSPGAFCKNNPQKNCGLCTIHSTGGASCKETSSIKDCYSVGV
ncbi:hypothetical protein UMM65_15825 [Aureibaculum sp. 2210JD6-5]|uniref:hypothetical protein n=1 Tax=Aureibaculum sp. 2210JD6-5 TaxID=3103957 RepID=UPI002AADB636|nr:hypothetical protein [Aureibaculum sp. 2210JD6-5]MDY7396717.1 hypothetical protein [Aureibaculum sp. 2210JD6-5]